MGPSISFSAILCLLATSACGSTSTEDKPTTDAGKDAASGMPPVEVSELPGQAFVFVGVQSGAALLIRGGETQTIVAVHASGEYLGGVEFGWSWQAGSTNALAADACTVRDDDGVAASPGTVSGQVTLSGDTSEQPPKPGLAWSNVATSTKTALLAGQSLDAGNIFQESGIPIAAHASGELQCTYTYGGDVSFGASGTFDGAALVGTQSDVNGWWLTLSSVIPAP